MGALRYVNLFLLLVSAGCKQQEDVTLAGGANHAIKSDPTRIVSYDEHAGKGALLLTRFSSLEEFKKMVLVQYADDLTEATGEAIDIHQVHLTYTSGGKVLTSVLKAGVSQSDFIRARAGTLWDKLRLGLTSPYALIHRKDLVHVENLGRRRPWVNGQGDVAFYDLAETMVKNIRPEDTLSMSPKDLSDKGYLNTFNHITAQALMTAMYSERLADFVADVHERYNMPELITGDFNELQLADFENGPVDNYVDMINNEWGQEIGNDLIEKYSIDRNTTWTPELVADFLNDIQSYQSWAFKIGFYPFKPADDMVVRFASKINTGRDIAL